MKGDVLCFMIGKQVLSYLMSYVHFQMHWVIACMDTSLRKIAIIVLGVSNARVLMHSTLFSLLP